MDKRLLDSRSQAEIDENFKRILALIDALTEKPGTPGPKGLQKNDIRHYICTGIGTECVVRKSDGSQ